METDFSTFLTDVGQVNTDYTNFFTDLTNIAPGRFLSVHDVDEPVLHDFGRRQPGHLDQRRQ